MKDFKVGIIQLPAKGDKEENLKTMEESIALVKKEGACLLYTSDAADE